MKNRMLSYFKKSQLFSLFFLFSGSCEVVTSQQPRAWLLRSAVISAVILPDNSNHRGKQSPQEDVGHRDEEQDLVERERKDQSNLKEVVPGALLSNGKK